MLLYSISIQYYMIVLIVFYRIVIVLPFKELANAKYTLAGGARESQLSELSRGPDPRIAFAIRSCPAGLRLREATSGFQT